MTDIERREEQRRRRNERRAIRGRDRSAAEVAAAKRTERLARDRWLAAAKAALASRWQR